MLNHDVSLLAAFSLTLQKCHSNSSKPLNRKIFFASPSTISNAFLTAGRKKYLFSTSFSYTLAESSRFNCIICKCSRMILTEDSGKKRTVSSTGLFSTGCSFLHSSPPTVVECSQLKTSLKEELGA